VKYYLLSANTTFVSFKKGNIITKKTLLTLHVAFDPDGFLSYPAGLKKMIRVGKTVWASFNNFLPFSLLIY
jgi:hypothetical protein